MKNQDSQEIRMLEYFNFRNAVSSTEHVNKIIRELKKSPQIHDSVMTVNFSDEGCATFDVIQNLPHVLIICFTGATN
jgi:hypothetical protein